VPVQQQGLTFSSEFFAQTSSLTPSSHSTSRSSSGSISGGSAGGYQHTGNIAPEVEFFFFVIHVQIAKGRLLSMMTPCSRCFLAICARLLSRADMT